MKNVNPDKNKAFEAINHITSLNIDESFEFYKQMKPESDRTEFEESVLKRFDTIKANGDQFLSDLQECKQELANLDQSGTPLVACLQYAFQAKNFLKESKTNLAWAATAESCYWCGRMKDRQWFEKNVTEIPKTVLANRARTGSAARAKKYEESDELIKKLIIELKPDNKKWKTTIEAARSVDTHITTKGINIAYTDNTVFNRIKKIVREYKKQNPTIFDK